MAVGPDEIGKDFQEVYKDMIHDLRSKIDAAIKRADPGANLVSVGLRACNQSVANVLTKEYRDSGWKEVRFREDQRDGWSVTLYTESGLIERYAPGVDQLKKSLDQTNR